MISDFSISLLLLWATNADLPVTRRGKGSMKHRPDGRTENMRTFFISALSLSTQKEKRRRPQSKWKISLWLRFRGCSFKCIWIWEFELSVKFKTILSSNSITEWDQLFSYRPQGGIMRASSSSSSSRGKYLKIRREKRRGRKKVAQHHDWPNFQPSVRLPESNTITEPERLTGRFVHLINLLKYRHLFKFHRKIL